MTVIPLGKNVKLYLYRPSLSKAKSKIDMYGIEDICPECKVHNTNNGKCFYICLFNDIFTNLRRTAYWSTITHSFIFKKVKEFTCFIIN